MTSAPTVRSPHPSAIALRKFRVTLCRPPEAYPIDKQERVDQLRRILTHYTKISTRFISANVEICSIPCEAYCITFTTAPEVMLDDAIRQQVSHLTTQQIRIFICEQTGIWPRFLQVKEVKE